MHGFLDRYDPSTLPSPGEALVDWSDPINRSLIGRWLCNEGAGSVIRNLAGQGDGVLSSGAGWSQMLQRGGVNFPGISGNIVTVSDQPSIQIGASSYSLVLDYQRNFTRVSSNYGIICKTVSGVSHPFFVYDDPVNTQMVWQHAGGYLITAYSAGGFNGGTLNHWRLAFVYDTSLQKQFFYANGLLAGSASNTNVGTEAGGNLIIGNRDSNDGYSAKNIANVSILKRALTADEVRRIYREPYAGLMKAGIRTYSSPLAPVGGSGLSSAGLAIGLLIGIA